MAHPLSTTAGIIAIVQLSSEVVKYVSGATGATKERKRLRNEVRACESILQRLNDEINDADGGRTWSETIKALEGDDGPLNWLWITLIVVKAKVEPKNGPKKPLATLKWPFAEQEVEKIISIIECAKNLLELALTNDCRKLIEEAKKSLNENGRRLEKLIDGIKKSLNENEKQLAEQKDRVGGLIQRQRGQERCSILDWLAIVDYAPQQNDFISRRWIGTGQQLLDSVEFQAWLETDKQTLFCPGIPGAGKTIITAAVVDHLCKMFRNNVSIGIAYLYCNFRRQYEQKVQDLLASLLKQLVQGQSSTPDTVKALYDRHKDERVQPSLDELSRALHSVTAIYSRVFIVIDALDECDAGACRTRLLSEIFNLQDKTGANLFATSRPTLEITEKFKESVSLTIRASNNDVRKYLDGRMSQLRLPSFVANSPALQEDIKTEIMKAVDGTFLLAQLHLDSLVGKKSLKAIRTALKNLPTGSEVYDHAYKDAMERIEGQFADAIELAKQVLSWITCAKRPLTTSELRHALAVEVGNSWLDEGSLPDTGDIVTVCAGLVTVDKESDIIRLVHYTAQEYFERTQRYWFPKAEADIAKVCVAYLSFNIFGCGFCQTDEEFEARLRSNVLYDYAARNWGRHVHAASTEAEELILHFLESEAKVFSSSQAMIASGNYSGYSQKVPRQMTGLHLAAYFGLETTIISLLVSGHAPDLKDSYGWTPLSWAARQGHEAVVNLLLTKGVDAASKDATSRTPLSWAAANGHEAVVDLLLTKGVDVDLKDANSRTPLSWASENGCKAVVKLLLAKGGVDPECKDVNNRTPLSWAAGNGHEVVVKLLLNTGKAKADSKATGQNIAGRTPLSLATENGHKAVVKLLLEKGADITIADEDGYTPLYSASSNGHTDVVKLLLEKGADITVATNNK